MLAGRRSDGQAANWFMSHSPRASTFRVALEKWIRDRERPVAVRLSKALDYVQAVAVAPWHLRGATSYGEGTRALAKPRIVNDGTLVIGDHCVLRSINTAVELVVGRKASLSIGHRCQLNYGVSIHATLEVRIGQRVHIGPYVLISDEAHDDLHDRTAAPTSRPVVIESDVWLGAKATVQPGVTIGRGAVVAAHALVDADVEPFTIVAGVPAKPIGRVDVTKFVCADEPIDPTKWPRTPFPGVWAPVLSELDGIAELGVDWFERLWLGGLVTDVVELLSVAL